MTVVWRGSAPLCSNPACGRCAGDREPIHRHVPGTLTTACGKRERDPLKPTAMDPKTGRPERKPPPLALTLTDTLATCADCRAVIDASPHWLLALTRTPKGRPS